MPLVDDEGDWSAAEHGFGPRMDRELSGFRPELRTPARDWRPAPELRQAIERGVELRAQHHISRSSDPCSSLISCDLVLRDEIRSSLGAVIGSP
jgi:hypothetical protein